MIDLIDIEVSRRTQWFIRGTVISTFRKILGKHIVKCEVELASAIKEEELNAVEWNIEMQRTQRKPVSERARSKHSTQHMAVLPLTQIPVSQTTMQTPLPIPPEPSRSRV
jgi:hypothetical protein